VFWGCDMLPWNENVEGANWDIMGVAIESDWDFAF
jgi:hypothetical protein